MFWTSLCVCKLLTAWNLFTAELRHTQSGILYSQLYHRLYNWLYIWLVEMFWIFIGSYCSLDHTDHNAMNKCSSWPAQLVVQPVVCIQRVSFSQLYNWLYNWLYAFNVFHSASCTTVCTTSCMHSTCFIQPVVQLVVQLVFCATGCMHSTCFIHKCCLHFAIPCTTGCTMGCKV